MYLKIEHQHDPDVYFIYKEKKFYDFRGFNSTTVPVNPVNVFSRYYSLYEELVDNIIDVMDYIKYDIDIDKKQVFIHNLIIEVYEGGD